ncbi:MAG: hypothetical protein K2X32_05930, partial [Phycisphaerales bacterium]|nr:hypothetical protein [Phycisphaerales bacterium]
MWRASEARPARDIAMMVGVLAMSAGVLAGPRVPEKPSTVEAADQLEQYLQSQGLESLLAEQLAQRLATASKDDRPAMITRLGKLYVQLLGRAQGAEERAYWLERSNDLVRQAPESLTFELKINLLRAQYAQSEEMGERWRLALMNEEQRAEVERNMRAHRVELERLALEIQRRIELLEKSDNLGRDGGSVQEELQDNRRLRAVALYYAGW